MRRKIFRSIVRGKNGPEIMEHNGFEVEIRERKYNVYRNEKNIVYIIDPATGGSVFDYHTDEPSEMDAAKIAVHEFWQTGHDLSKFEKMAETEEYKSFVDMFDALQFEWKLEEGLKE